MCGIFGVAVRPGASITLASFTKLLDQLYLLSESRGKESSGLHVTVPMRARAWTLKGELPGSQLIRTAAYRDILKESFGLSFGRDGHLEQGVVVLAHSRLVTNGSAAMVKNNQPVRVGETTVIHNGIIVNVDELWRNNPDLVRQADVDTEILAALLDDKLRKQPDPIYATRKTYRELKGAASIAWFRERLQTLSLATNTGDLYLHELGDNSALFFASEKYILEKAVGNTFGPEAFSNGAIQWVKAGHGVCYDLSAQDQPTRFSLGDDADPMAFDELAPQVVHRDLVAGTISQVVTPVTRDFDSSLVRYNESNIKNLRRCTACVLPETFPYIEFDSSGVCNYCRGYKPRYAGMHPSETRKKFIQSLEKYRRDGREPDVLVPFSGGRDSSYGLHLIHKEFGLKPITFTYDWGMVTDLARRNVARMCGQLGIPNILVSADIKEKRENIKKNVVAWLKKPDLGMVPLFMAGDKHFFRVVNQLKKQTGISLDLWCANPLENTDFKSGFCNVSPDFDKSRVDYLSLGRKFKMLSYYGSRFLTNPGYINSSLRDTFGAFLAYYFEPRRDFYFIFDHFVWNEDEVNKVLLSDYDWETSPDSSSTWRIGDGTAPFYNYIYMTARGFSEFDTFRSNQIREGMISRQTALDSIIQENRPRIDSLRWYIDTIGLDFNATIQRINTLDKFKLHV